MCLLQTDNESELLSMSKMTLLGICCCCGGYIASRSPFSMPLESLELSFTRSIISSFPSMDESTISSSPSSNSSPATCNRFGTGSKVGMRGYETTEFGTILLSIMFPK